MLRLNRPLLVLLACCLYFISNGQTSSCSAKFTYSIGNNNIVSFFATDTIGATQHWLFGDGSTVASSTSSSQMHQYFKPGTYEVKHYVEKTGSNCKDSSVQKITVTAIDNCKANFSFYKESKDTLFMRFINSSVTFTGVKKFNWSFGDGQTSADESPLHLYTKPGTYNVCLSIETNSGCSNQYCQQVAVVDSVDKCNFSIAYNYTKDSVNCKKIYLRSLISTTQNVGYAWTFGDGTSSHDANPIHEYANAGKFAVCLVVESGNNCRKVFCDSVLVRCGTDSCSVKPSFTWKANTTATNTISFESLVVPATNISYKWSFGDSSVSSYDANPVHTFSKPGSYNVCLLVKTNAGCERQVCMQVTIAASCNITARFEKHREASQSNTVYFSNVSQSVSNIWQTYWIYGDSSSSRDYNSFHTYANPGTYTACLKVIGLNGCTSTYCDTVIIKAPQKDGCKITTGFAHYSVAGTPLGIRYEALYNSSAAVYTWTFGDGSTGNGRMPTHQYSKAGSYTVCLQIKDGNCYNTHCDTITIQTNSNGRVAVSPNPAINTIALEVKLDKADRLSIRFMDASGGIRSTFTRDGNIGNNRFVLPVDKLSQGIYLVEIKSYNGAWYSRFVKG